MTKPKYKSITMWASGAIILFGMYLMVIEKEREYGMTLILNGAAIFGIRKAIG